jgi:hypothetical protein
MGRWRVRLAPHERDERPALLQGDPSTFFATPHFESSHGVIVRLSRVDGERLRELLTEGWRTVASKRMRAAFDENEET